MYDEADASHLAHAPGADFIESLDQHAGARRVSRRETFAVAGRQLTRVGVLDSIAKRLVILGETDVATTAMVALIHGANPRLASYIHADMRSLNGRAWWKMEPSAKPLTLAALGVKLELSGRTGGGVYFRAVGLAKTFPRHKAANGRAIYWRGNPTEWMRLHPVCEAELLP